MNFCRAWDSEGALLADGAFRLEETGRAAVGRELRPSHVERDKHQVYRIYLFGEHGAFSKALVPVKVGR